MMQKLLLSKRTQNIALDVSVAGIRDGSGMGGKLQRVNQWETRFVELFFLRELLIDLSTDNCVTRFTRE